MSQLMRCAVLIISMPVFFSLSGCPAMAAMRVAKKASESSSADNKNEAPKNTTSGAATDESKPAGAQ